MFLIYLNTSEKSFPEYCVNVTLKSHSNLKVIFHFSIIRTKLAMKSVLQLESVLKLHFVFGLVARGKIEIRKKFDSFSVHLN